MTNPILHTDSYKLSHFAQLPPGTQRISSYIEARVTPGLEHQLTQFFGLQAFLLGYLDNPILISDIMEAEAVAKDHGLPFHAAGWQRIYDEHDGFLPIEIEALPEGTIVPRGVPLVQVTNLDPELPWLTSYIETALLRSVWYPSSVATLSFLLKTVIYDALRQSSDDPMAGLPFKLHDFGARGTSSAETAALGGLAHLVNFQGTDTVEAILAARQFYACDMAGFSIPASEHSTMTAWGRENEAVAYENMMDEFGDGLFSIVSDSYDLFNAVENIYGGTLKERILGLEGKLIVRPDSGDPVQTPLKVLEALWTAFGGTVNSKGYRVLHPKVGVIQGDGLTSETIGRLCHALLQARFSVDNIAFGMGGGLLQNHKRDDMRFAMKANAIDFGDGWKDVQKNPATDPSKASKAGRQAVIRGEDGQLKAIRADSLDPSVLEEINELRPVWRTGEALEEEGLDAVRARADRELLAFHERVFSEEYPQQAA